METIPNSPLNDKEIGAYKLKDEKFDKLASKHLWPIQKKNRKVKDWPHRQFSKGSAVYDAMKQAGVLDLYYDPIYKEDIDKKQIIYYKKEIQNKIESLSLNQLRYINHLITDVENFVK